MYRKVQLVYRLVPSSELLCACPRPLLHGSNSCPIVDLHGLSTVCSITFAEAAAAPAGYEGIGGRGAQTPRLGSQLWVCVARIAWGSPETPSLPLPQGNQCSRARCCFPVPGQVSGSSLHSAPGTRVPRAPRHRERSGEARAVAISAVLTAASVDNEKPFCLAAIKLLPFHERNPESFLKPKQKSQPFIRFIII